MNTPELWEDIEEMTKISKYAEMNELTVDYVISEFVMDNLFVEV